MNTNIIKTWEIDINENEVFSRCTNESLHQEYRRNSGNGIDTEMSINDNDRGQFRVYYEYAIAQLHMMFARLIDESTVNLCTGGGSVSFKLQMHHNNDDNMIPILTNYCYDYIVKKVLEQWYLRDFGSELAKLEIKHCLHFRKHPVRRMIRPLF